MNILEIKNLSVEYYRHSTVIPAVRNVSFELIKGETLALVGESGSGKSTVALSVLGLIQPGEGKITSGEIVFAGKDILASSKTEWRALRGKDISLVFQDPFSSLNPVLTIGEQLRETVAAHKPGTPRRQQDELAAAALSEVMLTDTRRMLGAYPHQLSGGQRQRVALAIAIINRPKLLIADEPTTALDVTIQKEILDLIDKLKKELSLSVLLITHNLPLARQRSERVAVMYAGEIVELGPRDAMFTSPRHPYTAALISSVPKLKREESRRSILAGQPPDITNLPAGCAFWPRCSHAAERCKQDRPHESAGTTARVRCFLYPKQDT